MLLSLQNGVDNEERIARLSGHPSGMGAVPTWSRPSRRRGSSRRRPAGEDRARELGGGESARTERLRDVPAAGRDRGGGPPRYPGRLWQKFLFICAFSGVTALTRLPIGTVLADPATRALFRGTSEEVEAIARAIGIGLPDDCVEQALATASAVEPWGRGSLYGDLAGGRRLELEG
jgi:2-dehydropantoate 2-reductase